MLTEQEKNYVNAAVQGTFILTYIDTCELEVVPVTSTPVEACLLEEISKITLPLVEKQAKMVSISLCLHPY